MQATLTTATYDAEKQVLIPKEWPRQRDFQEVVVLFMPQRSNIIKNKVKMFDVLQRIWSRNMGVDPVEAERDIEQAIAEVRVSKRDNVS